VLTVLSGDWFDAARYYRAWATGAGIPWTSQGPMHSDASFPQTLKEAQMFLYTTVGSCAPGPNPAFPDLLADHSTFQYWPAHINEHKSFFGIDKLVTLVNGWEQKGLLAKLWRDWLPARSSFQDAVSGPNGVNSIPGHDYVTYFNANLYSIPSPFGPPPPGPCQDITDACAIQSAVRDAGGLVIDHSSNGSPMLDKTMPCGTSAVDLQPFYDNVVLDQRSTFIYRLLKHVLTTSPSGSSLDDLGVRGLYLDAFSIWKPETSYNHVVTAERGLSEGGGAGVTQGKLATLRDVVDDPEIRYQPASGSPQPMVFFTEGPQEMFLGSIQLNYGAGLDLTTKPPVRFTEEATPRPIHLIAPLFETVYHDYHLTAHPLQVVAPLESVSTFGTVEAFRNSRMEYGARLFFGQSLTGGSALSADLIASVRAAMSSLPTPRYEYVYWTDMIRNFTDLLKQDQVRDFTVFGERMRDPTPSSQETITVTADEFLPYGSAQPFVYVNAHRRLDEAQQRYAVGLLYVNWSHASDPAGTGPAGSQHVSVSFDPQSYGMSGTYQRFDIVGSGGVLVGPTVVAGTNPIALNNVFVPALGARFAWFEPVP
jgi:hypothetical protein